MIVSYLCLEGKNKKYERFFFDTYRNGHTTPSKADHIIQAPDGQGCPRCGGILYFIFSISFLNNEKNVKSWSFFPPGFVYHADRIPSKDRVWHKGCFKCHTCKRFLDSRIACDGPDGEVYCTGM